jgi:hypothetical protein
MTKSKFVGLVKSYDKPELSVYCISSQKNNSILQYLYLVDPTHSKAEIIYKHKWTPNITIPNFTKDVKFETEANKYQKWLNEALNKTGELK